jgi:hypothetical protein
MPAYSNFTRTLSSLALLVPTRPPRRPLQLTVSSTDARRCASGMVKSAPGGQLTPWKHMASSTSSASSTGRCAAPSACTPLACPRLTAPSAVQILRSERQPVPGPNPTSPGGSGTLSARSARVAFVFLCCARDAEHICVPWVVCPCACALVDVVSARVSGAFVVANL